MSNNFILHAGRAISTLGFVWLVAVLFDVGRLHLQSGMVIACSVVAAVAVALGAVLMVRVGQPVGSPLDNSPRGGVSLAQRFTPTR
jgi:hypothetical protein